MFGEGSYPCKTIKIIYFMVNANTSYNILLDRSSIKRLKAIMSTLHLAMKFPSAVGNIVTVNIDKKIARECYVASLKVESTSWLLKAFPRGQSTGRR